jgi:hypothetical protein
MSMKLVIATAAVVAALAGPSSAQEYASRNHAAHHAHQARTTAVRSSALGAAFDEGARAAYGRSYDFEGWPTDYLSNRFGDRQMQGRP